MAVTGMHHLVIRVEDFDHAVENWRNLLGVPCDRIDRNDALGIRQAFFNLSDGGFVEIVSPTNESAAVGKALASRGEGIHTIAMAVDDLAGTIAALKAAGAQLIGEGGPQVFIHPKSANGVLVQLSAK
ncbi:MAG: VOC family protein [Pseudomonadales bacterium]